MNYQVRNLPLPLGIIAIVFWTSAIYSAPIYAQVRQSSNSSKPILEISVFTFDAYAPSCREPLYARLYADGRLEVEDCSEILKEERKEKGGQSSHLKVKKEYQLSYIELNELLNLAEQPDFFDAKTGYSGGNLGDLVIKITIIYRGEKGEKEIRLLNIAPGKNEGKLPPSLNKLFLRIDELLKSKEKS